jgi:hypothetical protein
MKMTDNELKDVSNTLAREDLSNLKAIQSALNKELTYRYKEMNEVVGKQESICIMDDVVYCEPLQTKEKETKMNGANAYAMASAVVTPQETIQEKRIRHLLSRAAEAECKKRTELQRHFGMIDDERPATAAELVERIEKGQFILRDETKDRKGYYVFENITWRNPKIKKDEAGYDKAIETMDEYIVDVHSTIILEDEKEGLAAVKAFEKKKFH